MLDASGVYTSNTNGRVAAFGLGSPITAEQ